LLSASRWHVRDKTFSLAKRKIIAHG
jgi:hypothetical protein